MDFVFCFMELIMVLSTGCEIINITTSIEYEYISLLNYSVDVRDSSNIVFGVMACHNAHVALSRDKNNFESNTMELVIGGWANTKSVLRMKKQGASVVESYGNLLDCSATKWFSIDWSNEVFTFSAIDNGIRGPTLLEYSPLSHAIHYLGISTGWQAMGVWEFELPDHSSAETSLLYDASEMITSPVVNSEMITSSFVNSEAITSSYEYSDVMTSSFENSDVMLSFYLNSDEVTSSYVNSDEVTSSYVTIDVVTSPSDDVILSSSVQNEMITPFSSNNDIITPSQVMKTAVVSANSDSTAYHSYSTTTLPSTQQQCTCRCTKDENTPNSSEISVVVGAIIKSLSIDRKQLSSSKRRLISIPDIRHSSVSIGMFGVFILVCFILLIILPDLLNMIKYLHQYLTTRQRE